MIQTDTPPRYIPHKARVRPPCTQCSRPALHLTRDGYFCGLHFAAPRAEITPSLVIYARQLLRSGHTLSEAAERCDVSKSDLDLALWSFIDQPLARQPEGMF